MRYRYWAIVCLLARSTRCGRTITVAPGLEDITVDFSKLDP